MGIGATFCEPFLAFKFRIGVGYHCSQLSRRMTSLIGIVHMVVTIKKTLISIGWWLSRSEWCIERIRLWVMKGIGSMSRTWKMESGS